MTAETDIQDSPIVDVRFGGVGGQGIVLAGRLLGKAASLYDGKAAVVTQSYGPEARGGASRADVVISDHRVDYPFVIDADVLAVFFQEAYLTFRERVKAGALLLADDRLVKPREGDEDLRLVPATRTAEELGNRMAANVVMVGYLVAATGVVSNDAIEESVRSTLKPSIVDLNLDALHAGMALAPPRAGS